MSDTKIDIRCRCSSSTFTLPDVSSNSKVQELQEMIWKKSGISPEKQVIKTGFPPRLLEAPGDALIGSVLSSGVSLFVDEKPTDNSATGDTTAILSGTFPVLPSSAESFSQISTATAQDRVGSSSHGYVDEDLDKAIALSLSEAETSHRQGPSGESFEPEPIFRDRLADGSFIVRRFVDSDHSCLFTAVAYVIERNREKGFDLRSVVADTVISDPVRYNEGILGKPVAEYCTWILDPVNWGGGVELKILAEYYKREIAAYDIQTTNCYVFGSDRCFKERAMLVFDGLHYDALARSPFEDAAEELDLTSFDPNSPEGQVITDGALTLVRKLNATNQYTNTRTFSIRCDECGLGFIGAEQATDHGQQTGHRHFSQYS